MSNIFSALNNLKTNIFGGQSYVGADAPGSNTPILRKSAIELADRSPTSRLDNDPLHFSSISYPRDIVNDGTNGHYMLFYINVQNKTKFNYKGPGGVDVGGVNVFTESEDIYKQGELVSPQGTEYTTSGNTSKPSYSDEFSKLRGTMSETDLIKLSRNKQNREGFLSNSLGNKLTTRVTDSIAIYLPPNVTDSYANSYNATETGFLGFMLASGGKFLDQFRQKDMMSASGTALSALSGVFEEALKQSGSALIETFTAAEGGYELANKIFGRSANPYLEVLYGGPQLRTFNYSFKFAPKNEDEKNDVQKIIQMFRFHSAPEHRNDHNMFLGLPSEFDIHYMYQAEDGVANENTHYPKIATCVLQSVTTNFTPNGVKSHADGSPVVITMDLQFLETELITKDHINEGF
tara:strand:- start:706 stop:1923 length:1218 start_codon:yes stop_codon:yes gene_type:complete